MRAAQPFSSEDYSNNRNHFSDELVKSVFLLPPLPHQRHLQLGREDPSSVWVRSDEVLEVLLLAGLRAATRSDSEDKLQDGLTTMKHFLPGLQQSGNTPRLCLQVYLLFSKFFFFLFKVVFLGTVVAGSLPGLSIIDQSCRKAQIFKFTRCAILFIFYKSHCEFISSLQRTYKDEIDGREQNPPPIFTAGFRRRWSSNLCGT